MVDSKTEKLFRVLEETRVKVSNLQDWQRSTDTNRELRAIAEEREQHAKREPK